MYRPLERECFVPSRPVLETLDEGEHIGGHGNVRRLASNIIDLTAYIEGLEAALRCYADGAGNN